jgi:tetraprenyl-beta-curcumene synthase
MSGLSRQTLSRQTVTLRGPAAHAGGSTDRSGIDRAQADHQFERIRLAVALARASARELSCGLRLVSREVERWRARAEEIPDADLRVNALEALTQKRGNINGAALFWTLPDRRNRDLLAALVACEILADFLDCVNERSAGLGIANGRQLHLALVEAFDPDAEMSDYYRYHHSGDDGGYLRMLVGDCRAHCTALSGYEEARPFLSRAAGLSSVLAINHEPDVVRREQALREWDRDLIVERRAQLGDAQHRWYERTAGASAWLTVLAMLAVAAEPGSAARGAAQTYGAYLDSIAPAGAMLDSYGDIVEDATSGDHSYIAHYPSTEAALERVGELVRGSRHAARALPHGARHAVIVACMIAFYLSKDSVRAHEMRQGARELQRAGGPLVELLLPVLRLWRVAHGQGSA